MSSAFNKLCPSYRGNLTPTAPTAIRLWEAFTVTFYRLTLGILTTNLVDENSQKFSQRNIRDVTLIAVYLRCTDVHFRKT